MKSLSHCHALGIIEGMLFQIHDRVQTITWGFLLWRQCVISFTPARTGVITEGFAGEWGSWQHPALGLWWPEQRGEAGLCVFICSTLPSPQAAPHFPFLKSLFSLFCPGEHLTVFLPVRILLIQMKAISTMTPKYVSQAPRSLMLLFSPGNQLNIWDQVLKLGFMVALLFISMFVKIIKLMWSLFESHDPSSIRSH